MTNNKVDSFSGIEDIPENFYAICEEVVFPPINLDNYDIPENVLNFISERMARAYGVIPLSRLGTVLTVAVSDPLNVLLVDNLRLMTHLEISPVFALQSQINSAIDKYYSLKEARKKEAEKAAAGSGGEESKGESISLKEKKFDLDQIEKLSKQGVVVRAVNSILVDAVKARASDIHIEPFEKNVRIRYRIDGVLQETKKIEKKSQEAVTARLKLMSNLDITQRKVPQDGRFGFRAEGRDIDVRVSILPVDFGEKVVLRLLDKSKLNLDIRSLGFSAYALEKFEEARVKPFGMILLTGPTGSGKTTTLYSLLSGLNTTERNIITIEDPVEYNLRGITQVPVRHDIGLVFANILKATLRQSPDSIMVGEMRDFETADIAMKSALTGHIVFSTLHTNDAPSAITRLLNMDIEPFLISSSLNLVAAQRLVRKICPKCKESYQEDLSSVKDIPEEFRRKDVTLYRGKGCQECNQAGFRGRMAVVEALSFDGKLRDMVMQKASTDDIRKYAQEYRGMKTLRQDAMDKCYNGDTTFDEVLRVTIEF